MNIAEVTLAEVLAFRDARCEIQQRLLREYGSTLVSFTMNIAGPVKRSPAGDMLFADTVAALIAALGEPLHREELRANAGNEAFLVYAQPAEAVKAACMRLEEAGETGRLLDIDVLDRDGNKLSRPTERRCLICGGPVAPCARSRTHSVEEIRAKTAEILEVYACRRIGALAVQALLDEVRLSPKPGLVDSENNGAHKDMDLTLMEKSANALRGYFEQGAALGLQLGAECAVPLQQAGMAAEKTMLAATGGVNTHKGAVFCMGLLAAGAGMQLRGETGNAAQCAARIADGLQLILQDSHGERVLKNPAAGGARREARAGFPHAVLGLEELRQSGNGLRALLRIIAELEDTNLLWRGGEAGLRYLQQQAAELLLRPEQELEEAVRALDRECVKRNLSPGGAADLFAGALFLHSLEQYER